MTSLFSWRALLLFVISVSGCNSKATTISLLGGSASSENDSGSEARVGAPPKSGPEAGPGCSTDDDCPSDDAPHCNTQTGSCVGCRTDGDCASSLCNTTTFTCGTCIFNSDCHSATPICDFDDRKCVQCETAAQCPTGQVCSFVPHACTPRCQTAMDCAGSGRPICAVASAVCVQCAQESDCASEPQSPHCDLESGSCVECRTVADCPMGIGRCDLEEHFCSD